MKPILFKWVSSNAQVIGGKTEISVLYRLFFSSSYIYNISVKLSKSFSTLFFCSSIYVGLTCQKALQTFHRYEGRLFFIIFEENQSRRFPVFRNLQVPSKSNCSVSILILFYAVVKGQLFFVVFHVYLTHAGMKPPVLAWKHCFLPAWRSGDRT